MIKNLKTAILHLHPEPLLDPSPFGKQRIVAIKKPTSKYSSNAIGRFLAPELWHSWQGRRKNTSVIKFIQMKGFQTNVFWETIMNKSLQQLWLKLI